MPTQSGILFTNFVSFQPSFNYYYSVVSCRVRELKTSKVGTLLRITGQVVRTHPVHPELVKGTFVCLDCQTVVKDVEQQFKYTQVSRSAVQVHSG